MANVIRTVGAGGHETTIAAALTWMKNGANYTMGTDDIGIIRLIDAAEYNESNLDFSGFTGTASATSHVRLECSDAARHDGTYNTSKARIRGTTAGQHVITIGENYTHIKGVAIMQDSTGTSDECIRVTSGVSNALIEKCVFVLDNNVKDQDCIYAGNWSVTDINVFDCVFRLGGANSRAAINAQIFNTGSLTQTWRIEHCTVDCNGADDEAEDGEGGISAWAEVGTSTVNYYIYNTAVFDPGSNVLCYNEADQTVGAPSFLGTINWYGDGNIASDTSAEGAPRSFGSSYDSVTMRTSDAAGEQYLVTNLTAGSEDYQLKDGSTGTDVAINAAVDGSAEKARDSRIDLDYDVAGNARPATFANRDIGAFEVQADSGPITITVPTGPLW